MRYILTISLLFFSIQTYSEFKIPRLTQPVIDQVGLLSPQSKTQLNNALRALHGQGGSQIQVLLIPSLEGETIEQASIRITDQWKLGKADADNGVLLLVAKKERRIRIEVGQGLEGRLTDAHAKRIIDEVMLPLFRSQHAESGIILGVVNIAKYTDPGISLEPYFKNGSYPRNHVKKERSLFSRVFTILFFLLMLFLFIKNPMLFLMFFAGGGRGGYGGGGYGGGGGYSGGGGGFSGGGASGGW